MLRCKLMLLGAVLFGSTIATLSHAQTPNFDALRYDNKYYLQCAANLANASRFPGYKSDEGYIGMYQFDVHSAYKAGLCKAPVPQMRTGQLWRLCDFEGPIAKKYNINSQFELRTAPNAAAAQTEMMRNLSVQYDDYIYAQKYNRFFGKLIKGIPINSEILRGILHKHGKATLDAFMKDESVIDAYQQSVYSTAKCMQNCMNMKGESWLCKETE